MEVDLKVHVDTVEIVDCKGRQCYNIGPRVFFPSSQKANFYVAKVYFDEVFYHIFFDR